MRPNGATCEKQVSDFRVAMLADSRFTIEASAAVWALYSSVNGKCCQNAKRTKNKPESEPCAQRLLASANDCTSKPADHESANDVFHCSPRFSYPTSHHWTTDGNGNQVESVQIGNC